MRPVEITYRCEDARGRSRPHPSDADDALYRLREGNRVFASLFDGLAEGTGIARHTVDINPRDLGLLLGEDGVPRQRPFAAVLGCSDARVPVELIFSEWLNDLFVVRVAGNGLGAEVLGSLQYAIDHLRDSLCLVVVLGHSGCGALSAAVDLFLEPAGYLPLAGNHALRSILDRQLIVVQATARRLASVFGQDVSRRAHYREALIEASIGVNAALTAYAVQQEFQGFDPRQLRAVYGVYLLQSREVWGPLGGDTDNGLAGPPRDANGFVQLGNAIVRSARITSLLSSE
jgi:carbonic anhydrase